MLPTICPCCSDLPYEDCCKPIHNGQEAVNAEVLMRSRFAAHALGLCDYILRSWASSARGEVDQEDLALWLSRAKFGRLHVLAHQPLNATDTSWVEFIAWYRQDNQLHALHDRSHFIREDGHWRYLSSHEPQLNFPKLGRNDPCPCGSGKKHKQCCIASRATP